MSDTAQCITIQSTRLDARSAAALLADARIAFEAGARRVVIDMARVTHMDSLGLSALGALLRRAPHGTRVVLASLHPGVRAIARMTHLHEVFDIFPSVEAALRVAGVSPPLSTAN